MKGPELSARPIQENGQTPQNAGILPASSNRGPSPCPTGHDSADGSLRENDPTRAFIHQLSQTLTSLRGTLELALLIDCDAQDYRRAIQESLNHAEDLVQLFKSYRASAHRESGRPGE